MGGLGERFASLFVDVAAVGRVEEGGCGEHVEDGAGVGNGEGFALGSFC
jgi:hypothetical protein